MKPITWVGIIGLLLILIFSIGAKFSLEDISQCKYSNIATATNTYLAKGSVFLKYVTINTRAVTSGVCTIYDSLTPSGTKIATIDCIGSGERTQNYEVIANTGLTVVTTTGGTAPDLTISYR